MLFEKLKLVLVDEDMNVIADPKIYDQYFDEMRTSCGEHTLTADEVPHHSFKLSGEC